jgi:hypothetical protein
MSSHVMFYLRLLLKRTVLLPALAVALRLSDIIPRHVLPPSLAEAASMMRAARRPSRHGYTGVLKL